jgi:sec-independent protein translocase protein TatA
LQGRAQSAIIRPPWDRAFVDIGMSLNREENKWGEIAMGTFSIWHWLIVLVVVLVLFGGGGKISRLMGDFGKGLKSFKKGMKEDEAEETAESAAPKELKSEAAEPAASTSEVSDKDKAANG